MRNIYLLDPDRVREMLKGAYPEEPKKAGRPRTKKVKEAFALAEEVGVYEACRQLEIGTSTYYRHKQWTKP